MYIVNTWEVTNVFSQASWSAKNANIKLWFSLTGHIYVFIDFYVNINLVV